MTQSGPGPFPLGHWTDSRLIERPAAEVIAAVQDSCQAVADRPARLTEEFYDQLFKLAPATRSLFAADMTEQMQKMTETLLAAISQLATDDVAGLESALRRLGAEHYRRYRVEPEHYVYIGHALTRAVRKVATWRYDGYLSSCWVAVCRWVTAHMIVGTRQAMAEERSRVRRAAAVPGPRPAAATAGGARTALIRESDKAGT